MHSRNFMTQEAVLGAVRKVGVDAADTFYLQFVNRAADETQWRGLFDDVLQSIMTNVELALRRHGVNGDPEITFAQDAACRSFMDRVDYLKRMPINPKSPVRS